ncbi:MAG: HPr family phosphocarrier protein [Kiritimatiellia bacterium]
MKQEPLIPAAETHSILLVDDAEPIRQRLRKVLDEASAGVIVAEAASVAEAINQYEALKPGTILLDLGLPDGDGIEVLRHAKTADSDCVVVILSNYADPETRKHCAALGADFVFSKSHEFEHAISAVRHASERVLARISRKAGARRLHSANLVVSSPYGLHVRPAAQLVKVAQGFKANIHIAFNGGKADAKSILEVMTLGAEHGAEVAVTAEGGDAAKAIAALEALFAGSFNESNDN